MIEKKFKHTDIGLVPEDWEVKTLEEVSSFPTESILTSNIKMSEYVGTDNMVSDRGGILPFNNTLPYTRVRHYVNNDILTSNIRPYLKKIWLSNREGGCSSDVLVIRPRTNIVMPNFLFTVISSDNFFKYSNDNAKGTKMPRGDKHYILKYGIPFPPISEQHRIASALMKVDALISNVDKLIAKKHAIKKGAMQELLTGKKRLPGFNGEWRHTTIGDITGPIRRGQSLQSKDFEVGFVPVIAGGKVIAGLHNIANYNSRSITISGSGASAGYVWLHENPIFATDCSVIKERDDFSLNYIYYYLSYKQEYIYSLQTGGAQPHIYPANIESIELNAPTVSSEQTAIANVLSTMDSEISVLEEKRDKYRHIKQGMMCDLLTGRIRLVENVDKESKQYAIGMTKYPFEEAFVAEPHPD